MAVALRLIALVLAVSAGTARAEAPIAIVLSWDGVRHDFPERTETPALDRMEREGARAARLETVFPSNTFPSHVALATGTYADRHGIVHNAFFEPGRGRYTYSKDASWIDAEPIWVAAERQGVTAAAYFWVGSETDWHGIGATYRKTPFDGDVPESAKVDQILAWLDLPEAKRPRLILSWWHGTDSVGHANGPDSPEIGRALAGQDAQLARLLDGLDARGLWKRTTLFVVADHGMTTVDTTVDPEQVLAGAGIAARATFASGAGFLFLEDVDQKSRALEVLRAVPGIAAHASDAVPGGLRIFRPGRTGDITVIAEPPVAIRPDTWKEWASSGVRSVMGWQRGMHGYRPDHPDMGAIFYALGRGVPAGTRPGTASAIDVAPTLSALLGIAAPKHAEGTVIRGIGAAPAGE